MTVGEWCFDVRATWSMGDWDSFEWFVHHTQEEVAEGAFLRAVLALRHDDLALCGWPSIVIA